MSNQAAQYLREEAEASRLRAKKHFALAEKAENEAADARGYAAICVGRAADLDAAADTLDPRPAQATAA